MFASAFAVILNGSYFSIFPLFLASLFTLFFCFSLTLIYNISFNYVLLVCITQSYYNLGEPYLELLLHGDQMVTMPQHIKIKLFFLENGFLLCVCGEGVGSHLTILSPFKPIIQVRNFRISLIFSFDILLLLFYTLKIFLVHSFSPHMKYFNNFFFNLSLHYIYSSQCYHNYVLKDRNNHDNFI